MQAFLSYIRLRQAHNSQDVCEVTSKEQMVKEKNATKISINAIDKQRFCPSHPIRNTFIFTSDFPTTQGSMKAVPRVIPFKSLHKTMTASNESRDPIDSTNKQAIEKMMSFSCN